MPGIREFEQRTGHRVEFEPADVEKFVVQFAAGAAADQPQAANYLMPKLFDQNAIVDLTAYVNRDKLNLRRDYGLMGLEFWGGKILSCPRSSAPTPGTTTRPCSRKSAPPTPGTPSRGS